MDLLWLFVNLAFTTGAYASIDPCHSYNVLNEPHRSTAFTPETTDRLICDRALANGWYRFTAGEMPTSCVNAFHCGTQAPIWLHGTLPSVADGIVPREACVNYGVAGTVFGGTTCCNYKFSIEVKNCTSFYVYNLVRTPGCSMAYCAGSKPVCSLGTFNPGTNSCNDLYPKMTEFPVLERPRVDFNHDVIFACNVKYPTGSPSVAFDVTWTVDDNVIIDPATGKPLTSKLTGDQREAILNAKYLQGNLGKTVRCNVTSYFINSPGVRSDILKSQGYWAGIRTSHSTVVADEKGNEQEIEIESTLPIPCHNHNPHSCTLKVEMKTSNNPNDISTTGCVYELRYDPNTHTYKAPIKIKATRDFLDDKDKSHVLSFRPLFDLNQPMWMGYKLDPVQIRTKDRKHGLCQANGDPHFRQIDYKGRMDVYEVGDMVMYKSKTRAFEVQIRTWSCGHYHPCICAVIAREGNDVIQVDACQRRQNQITAPDVKIMSQGPLDGTTIDRDPSGKTFFLNFPSGARVKVLPVMGHARKGENDPFLNVEIQAPTDDVEASEGLCGSLDGDATNDFEGADGVSYNESDKIRFMRSWKIKPGSSFFDAIPPHEGRYELNEHYCACKNGTADCTKGTGANNPSKRVCNSKCTPVKAPNVHPRDLGYSDNYPDQNVPDEMMHLRSVRTLRRRSWPTPNGITNAQAIQICTRDIMGSSLAARCGHMAEPPKQHYIDDCVEDMMYADGDLFNMAHMNAYDSACQDVVLRNVSNYKVEPNGDLIPPADVTSHVCPNQCSRRGTCLQGTCNCNHGFTSADCSVPIGVTPVIDHFRGDGVCDVSARPCQTVNVIAENMLDTPELACRYRNIEIIGGAEVPNTFYSNASAIYKSFLEAQCPIPLSNVHKNEGTTGGFLVSITTDGHNFSPEQKFLIYDGKCRQCDPITKHCTLKSNTCDINGQCHLEGEQNDDHQICKPSVSQTEWSTDANVGGVDHYTATVSGCACTFDPTRFDCACCQNGGCQCGQNRPGQCAQCGHLDMCADDVIVN